MGLTGVLNTLFTFDCTNGNEPSSLVLGADGNYYGTTFAGGSGNGGTVFKLTPAGSFTLLYQFQGTNLPGPLGPLAQGRDGNFYGVTYGGGSVFSYGTVYKITPHGVLTTLYEFDFTHGAQPYAGMILGADGNFYGTTYSGGAYGGGTAFRITPAGALTVIYNFGGTAYAPDAPVDSLVQGSDGNFYGTTSYGGGSSNDGTVFKLTPSGTFSVLHAFTGTDGYYPSGPLVQGSDGSYYGAVGYGGAYGNGAIYKVTSDGQFMTVYDLTTIDGAGAFMLVQDTNGTLYGLTNFSPGTGSVFSLGLGLKSFVETVPSFGTAGSKVKILGTNLSGTSSVSFNGTAATFRVNSSSEIVATVPPGATSGRVTVITSNSTLVSNKRFIVK